MLYIVLGALLLPLFMCLLALVASTLLSPIWLAFIIRNNIKNRFASNILCCTIVVCYPLLSLAMTLLLVAYSFSYLIFRNNSRQDIYQPLELGILRYSVSFLVWMRWLTHL